MKPLVSILIPAYNAEEFIADAIRSAIAQTWQDKEIIVVDDGSTDGTAEVARGFASKSVVVVSKENQGPAAARNFAYQLSQGEYIQWLDADDLLAPDKIEKQTATWLTSRELAEAAGPWDLRLHVDDDGEYFCRVLLASEGTRFCPEARVYYRVTPSSRVSHIGVSDKKKDAMLISMRLQIQYLRSLEKSARVQKACLAYMQDLYVNFYPERPDLMAELQTFASELGGRLEEPRLRWKYAWIEPILGFNAAKRAQMTLPLLKTTLVRSWDKAMC
jgi:glycosyltransferase involved in cell wall biosynthesis